eukprot:TRINITY_DN1920_c0_g1_i3.p1 TRINITY_DN1920_c0_g1~~TRINITY_DN1920_c0_g1_i3.p1  ORF type:complete len:336 (+),score=46.58 TRINITY_DN1920_c0_g1_i3:1089-2096(+)
MDELSYVPREPGTRTHKKSLLVAYLLALPPLGLFGLHRLYLGQYWHFFTYVFTGGNFGLGWIVDFIFLSSIVSKNNETLHAENPSKADKTFINTFVLWLPPAGLFGLHRFYHGHHLHGYFYAFTGGNFGLSWMFDLCRLSSLVKGEKRNHFDAFVLWLPPSGIFGAHRAYAGHILHAICYALTGGNMGLAWLLDVCRLSTLIPKVRIQSQESSDFSRMEEGPDRPRSRHERNYNDEPDEKNSFDAYMLWLPPLGLFGMHNYYLGRTKCAIVQTVLPPLGIFLWFADMCFIPSYVRKINNPTGHNVDMNDTSAGLELEENYVPLQIMTRHSEEVDD